MHEFAGLSPDPDAGAVYGYALREAEISIDVPGTVINFADGAPDGFATSEPESRFMILNVPPGEFRVTIEYVDGIFVDHVGHVHPNAITETELLAEMLNR